MLTRRARKLTPKKHQLRIAVQSELTYLLLKNMTREEVRKQLTIIVQWLLTITIKQLNPIYGKLVGVQPTIPTRWNAARQPART